VEFLGLRKGWSRLQIFLTIQTSSLNKCDSSFRWTRNQDQIDRKKLLVIYSYNVSNLHLAPLDLNEHSIPENPGFEFMVQLFIRFVSLIIFVAWMNASIPYLSIEIPKTNASGAHAVRGPSGLMMGIVCRTPMIKKYMLAILLNWRSSASNNQWIFTWKEVVPSVLGGPYVIGLK